MYHIYWIPFFLPITDSFFFNLFRVRATPMAYGGSQVRGLIGAVAAGLHHSSRQRQILAPLSEARDRIHDLMVPSWIRFLCIHFLFIKVHLTYNVVPIFAIE